MYIKGSLTMRYFIKAKDSAIMRTPISCFESSYQNSKYFNANDSWDVFPSIIVM